MNGTDPPSLPTYVEKITKYTRRAAPTAELGILSTSAAKLRIAKLPPCVCGLPHALHDCYILNLSHLSRPKDWTPPPIGVRKVEQAWKDPRVAKRIDDALRISCQTLQIDNGLPPHGQTSLAITLLDEDQLSPTHWLGDNWGVCHGLESLFPHL
jgi:hypothetical protein